MNDQQHEVQNNAPECRVARPDFEGFVGLRSARFAGRGFHALAGLAIVAIAVVGVKGDGIAAIIACVLLFVLGFSAIFVQRDGKTIETKEQPSSVASDERRSPKPHGDFAGKDRRGQHHRSDS